MSHSDSRRNDSTAGTVAAEQVHPGQLAGTRWDTAQYLRFADHRLRPALELLDRVPLASPGVICDLGCGTGSVTRIIAARWPDASVTGVDNSAEMLAAAAATPASVRWVEEDICRWHPAQAPDLIFSNATLHWVQGHRELLPRLGRWLKPGGCLAVQMPLSWAAPSHVLMRATLADGGLNGATLGNAALRQSMNRDWVEPTALYYELLAGWVTALDIWETEYLQVLQGEDAVLEWVRSAGLRPVLSALDERERGIFLAEYARRLRNAYPQRADGSTLYPFRRLFIVATV